MRAGLGILSLLICVAIGAYLWSLSAGSASKQNEPGGAVDQARQISGHAADGTNALDSVKTDAFNDGSNHFKALLVTDVKPGGAMETFYGLKKGDKITVEGQYDVLTADAGMANAMLLDAYEKSAPLTVIRDGKEMTLPQSAAASTPAVPTVPQASAPTTPPPAANPAPAAPAAPTGPRSQQQVIQDQLKEIGAGRQPDGQ